MDASDGIALDSARRDAMLERMAIGKVAHDIQGLELLYTAWLQTVPFCSSLKRIHYGAMPDRPGPLPASSADSFVDMFLRHGCGGTCFPTAEAWLQLLRACGFQARRALGSMLDFPQIPGPNHGTVIVTLHDRDWMVDPFFGSEVPLPLDTAPNSVGRPSLTLRTEPDATLPIIHWRFHNARQWFRFGFAENWPVVSHEDFISRYEASTGPNSVFNSGLYVSRHVGPEVHTIYKNEYYTLSDDDKVTRTMIVDQRNDLLTRVFGYSSDFCKLVPPDIKEE